MRFVNELVLHIKPAYPIKFARLVAAKQWLVDQDKDPAKAARDWHAAHRK